MIRVFDEVAADHPTLAGHFPGNPTVPGVLLLARVLQAVARACGAPVARVPGVKFLAPLAPGQQFQIEFESALPDGGVKFRVLRGATLIASGAVELQDPAA